VDVIPKMFIAKEIDGCTISGVEFIFVMVRDNGSKHLNFLKFKE
jgi:hypothetical protein